jgi:nucleoside-diphosphate-sugar epimerase
LADNKKIEVHRGAMRGWMHVSDAVRAIESSARLNEFAVINIGHPDIRPIEELAEMIRMRLGVPRELLRVREMPERMTRVKRPCLQRQEKLLNITPNVGLEEGVERVCRRVEEESCRGGIRR